MCQLGAAQGCIVVYWVHMHHADMAEACQHQYVLMARVCPLDDQLHPACSPAARAPVDHCCGADLVESLVQQLSAASGTCPGMSARMHLAQRAAGATLPALLGGPCSGVGARRRDVDVMGLRSPNRVSRVLASKFVGTISFLRGRVGRRVL